MLITGQAVQAGIGAVAQHQAVAQKLLLNGADRAQEPGVVCGDEPDAG